MPPLPWGHRNLLVYLSAAVGSRASFQRKHGGRLLGRLLAHAVSGLLVDLAALLVNAVRHRIGTTQVQCTKLPAIRPEGAAGITARIAVAEPFALAAGLLPVADLDLAIRAVACSSNVERRDLAVGIEANAVLIHHHISAAVAVTSAVVVVSGFDVERDGGRCGGGARAIGALVGDDGAGNGRATGAVGAVADPVAKVGLAAQAVGVAAGAAQLGVLALHVMEARLAARRQRGNVGDGGCGHMCGCRPRAVRAAVGDDLSCYRLIAAGAIAAVAKAVAKVDVAAKTVRVVATAAAELRMLV